MTPGIKLSTIGIWLATGAIFQDYSPIPTLPAISLAKIMFLVSLPFLASAKFSSHVSKLSLAVFQYSILLVLLSFGLGAGGISDRTISVSVSLIIGFLSYIFIAQAKISKVSVVRAFEFWVIASSLLGIFQAVTGAGFVSARSFEAYIIPGIFRASGFTDDPNYFALLCLMGLALSASGCAKHPKLLAGLALVAVVLSGSRAGTLTALAMILIERAGGFLSARRMLLLVPLTAISVGLIFAFKNTLPSGFQEMFNSNAYVLSDGANSLSFRMTALLSGVQVFLENPMFGYGLGNNVYHPDNVLGLVSHNSIVETAAESGLVGLAMYCWIFIQVIRTGIRRSSERSANIKLAISLLFAAMFIMSLTLVTEYSRIFFFFLALVAILAREEAPARLINRGPYESEIGLVRNV